MNIAPKLGARNTYVPRAILPYLGDTAEFQLFSYTQNKENWKGLIRQHGLKHITLHAPFGAHNIEDVCLSPELLQEFEGFLADLLTYAEEHCVHFHLLFHLSRPVESLRVLPVLSNFNQLLLRWDSPFLSFLIENTLVDLDSGERRLSEDPISYFLARTPANRVQFCFDLCHYLSSKHVVKEEYLFQAAWLSRIYQIHFSATKNYEGYIHGSSSHGLVHNNIWEVGRDLCSLRSLGIDLNEVILVTEITESNYFELTDQARELKWLHYFKNLGGLFNDS